MYYSITIDGGAGSGKSTLAKNIQKELRAFTFIDTGAYYRWATYLCLENNVDVNKEKEVYKLVKDQLDLQFIPLTKPMKDENVGIYWRGEKINKKLFGIKVTAAVSTVALYKSLRKAINKKIKEVAKKQHVIVVGREIGTEVLPKAPIKIWLKPSIDARARRRFKDHIRQGRSVSYGQLKKEISHRDDMDTNREFSPLRKADDAYEIDNTHMLPSDTCKETLKYIYKTIPEIKDLKPEVIEINQPTTSQTNSFGQSFTGTTSQTTVGTETKESMSDLKKRLLEKHKKKHGGGSFWERH